jgi:hypothetical protein
LAQDLAEIAKVKSLAAFVSNLSSNVDGLGVMLYSLLCFAFCFVGIAEIAEVVAHVAFVTDLPGDTQGLGVVRDSLIVIALV